MESIWNVLGFTTLGNDFFKTGLGQGFWIKKSNRRVERYSFLNGAI
jgi:hypothetical protein